MRIHILQYYMIQEDSFASFSYDTSLVHREKRSEILHGEEATATKKIHFDQIPPLELCINRIASVIVFNNTYEFDISEVNGKYLFFQYSEFFLIVDKALKKFEISSPNGCEFICRW